MTVFTSSVLIMKFFINFLIFYTVAVCGTPIKENNNDNNKESGVNGWYVPLLNGSLQWMSLEEADNHLDELRKKSPVATNAVKFFLYTRKNPEKSEKIIATEESISRSNFNPKKPTRFTIHGWLSGLNNYINTGIRKAWLNHEDCNMIAVDWTRARSVDYSSSVLAVPGVGKKIAALIDFLVKMYKVKLNTIELIGHSLGAHVAGYAGKYIKSGKIRAIYGLDPALPLYSYNKPQNRLNSTDANYVETIHTNGGKLGFLKPLGTSSFYPNGGKSQPGCGFDITGKCSHTRVISYYVEAVEKDNFISHKCDNYQEASTSSCASTYKTTRMASKSNAIINPNGEYFVPVRETSPFGMLS